MRSGRARSRFSDANMMSACFGGELRAAGGDRPADALRQPSFFFFSFDDEAN